MYIHVVHSNRLSYIRPWKDPVGTTHLDPGVDEGHGVDVGAQGWERGERNGGKGGGWGGGLGRVSRVTGTTAAPRRGDG